MNYLEDERKYKIKTESKCKICSYLKLCRLDVEKRCLNFEFGSSAEKGCFSCLHRYNRTKMNGKKYDSIFLRYPCFICKDFKIKSEEEFLKRKFIIRKYRNKKY